jgi:hypothetical protein
MGNMRGWKQLGMAAIWAIFLAGGSAAAQTAPSSPPPSLPGGTSVSPIAFVAPPSLEDAPASVCATEGGWDCSPCLGYGRFWVNSEALLWWMKGARLPALVTTNPPGTPESQAGKLDTDSTAVLFGASTVNNNVQGGWRITAGYWLDNNRRWGIEGSYFLLSSPATHFSAGTNDFPILARPFVESVFGGFRDAGSKLISFPNRSEGSISATALTTGLTGAGALFRANLCCGSCYRIDWLGGYRFLRFSDRINIDETLSSTGGGIDITPPGTVLAGDHFATRNVFHGFDTGLSAQFQRGRWAVEGLAKVAVGGNQRVLDINGSASGTPIGPTPQVGDLLTQPSNIGHFSSEHVAVIPEFGMRLYYQITPWLRANAGYTFLLWPQVIRAGDAIDTVVNPFQQGPLSVPQNPPHPAPTNTTTTFWAQGISAGLELRF